ncbi:hypothetical protein [Comamonas endophytica]|uniref:Uncharacterized protein n=2 Tax=Comamonas endophytica TaxID=2949090 RepID=A0ABY6GFU1_9BURK|nr:MULTISPECIES: hypothetical protein [unclassified Acidovorax]MCD2514301.1 hypothetical protein [Acidovorax sp. D4N7]UYG53550.1 hypothetical protein M9799_19490 [Acidovorax sp. 5MLIR]
MVTVWKYKKDGAQLDFSHAFNNAMGNDKKAIFSVTRSPGSKEAMLTVEWLIGEDLPGATLIEMMAKIDVYSDENLKEMSKILGRSANSIDKNIVLEK